MKKTVLTLALTLSLLSITGIRTSARNTSIPASDSRVTWVGRTAVRGQSVSFDWSATYVRVSFEGDYLAVKASDTKSNLFNVWIDRPISAEPDQIFKTGTEEQTVTLADKSFFKDRYGKKAPAKHYAIIMKRTEGSQGTTTFSEFITSGEFFQAEPLKERMIEFVGDSYTCGYGAENCVSTDPFTPETETSSKTYAAIISRYFDADFVTVAHSGQGIARNYGDGDRRQNMPIRYGRTFDENPEVKWDATSCGFKPAMTVIYLGTNDFSTGKQPLYKEFRENYMSLLRQIKSNYGEDHPVLCVSSKQDDYLFTYVRDIVTSCGLKNVYYDGMFEGVHENTDRNLGADWHPNYLGHIKLSYAMIPYVSTITGWDIENKTIE